MLARSAAGEGSNSSISSGQLVEFGQNGSWRTLSLFLPSLIAVGETAKLRFSALRLAQHHRRLNML